MSMGARSLRQQDCIADPIASYEALPPNFSLGANMLAGAFAGIAVRSPNPSVRGMTAKNASGTLGDVSRRHAEGTRPL